MKKLVDQLVKFGIVGVICFGIDYGLYTFLCIVWDVHYLIAGFVGFTCSVIINYLLSMKYVFIRREDLDKKKEFIIFIILSVIGLGVNEVIIWACFDGLYRHVEFVRETVSPDAAKLIGKLFATAVVMIYNFITRKILLEKKDEN